GKKSLYEWLKELPEGNELIESPEWKYLLQLCGLKISFNEKFVVLDEAPVVKFCNLFHKFIHAPSKYLEKKSLDDLTLIFSDKIGNDEKKIQSFFGWINELSCAFDELNGLITKD
ncbi:MAG: hypothetical protein Q9P90_16830, partial [candidate division KSB1 bacterium]|nr:hypothetical protein [candidate division KSB1 bacterium]